MFLEVIAINCKSLENDISMGIYDDKFVLVSGGTESGKTETAQKLYGHLLNKTSSTKILVLVKNSFEKAKWLQIQNYDFIEKYNVYTYNSFVKNEVDKYWPYITASNKNIKKNRLRPQMIDSDMRENMIESLADYYMNKKGYLYDITASPIQVAGQITECLNQSALSNIPYDKICERLYKLSGTNESKKTYDEMQEIINHYMKTVVQNGCIDSSLSVYYYNDYLLKNKKYLAHIHDTYDYVIADNFEDASFSEMNLFKILIESVKGCMVVMNFEKPLMGYGEDAEFIKRSIESSKSFEEIVLDENDSLNDDMKNFIDIVDGIGSEKSNCIYTDVSFEFRSSMLKKVRSIVEECLSSKNSGYIAVLSPFPDESLVQSVDMSAKKYNTNVFTNARGTSGRSRMVKAVLTCAMFCGRFQNAEWSMDALTDFFSLYLGTDYIESFYSAKNFVNGGILKQPSLIDKSRLSEEQFEKYSVLWSWVQKESTDKLDIGFLMRKIYIELLSGCGDFENISEVEKASDAAQNYDDMMRELHGENYDDSKIPEFLENDNSESGEYRGMEKLMQEKNGIIVASFKSFMDSFYPAETVILTDFISRGWLKKFQRELSNDMVLKSSWDTKTVYTDEIENDTVHKNYIKTIKNIAKKCRGSMYILGSRYSVSGYEEDNKYAEEIIEKSGGGR